MRKFLLPFFVSPLLSLAQWTTDPMLNTIVRDSVGFEEATPLIASVPDGKTYVSYFASVGGSYQLHMQLLDVDGTKLWGNSGLVVSSFPQNSALYRYDLKSDLFGNAVVAFQDERLGYLSVVAYKIDEAGNFLWGATGIQLGDSLASQDLAPAIGITSDNNAVIAWNSNGGSSKWIAYQKISSAGTFMWAHTHRIIDSTNVKKYSRPSVVAMDNDRFMMMLVEETGTFPYTCYMYMQKFDTDGSPLLPAAVQVSTYRIAVFHFPKVLANGYAGAFIAFDSGNPSNASLNDAFAQYMDTSIAAIWTATGIELSSLAVSGEHKNIASIRHLPDSNQVVCCMKVLDHAQGNAGVYIQRLDMSGNKMLGADGATVFPLTAVSYYEPYDAVDSRDGLIIIYALGSFANTHLHASKTDYNGTFLWTPAQTDLSLVNSNKYDVSCSDFRNNQVVVVWEDERNDQGVYAQNINTDGTTGIVTWVSDRTNKANLVAVYPNPVTNGFTVRGSQLLYGEELKVFDVLGKVVFSSAMLTTKLKIETTNWDPGVYFLCVGGNTMKIVIANQKK